MKQNRHNMDTVAYAETLINSKHDIVTMTGRDAAGLKIGLKKAPQIIREAIEDYEASLQEQTSPAIVEYIKAQIERLKEVLNG